MRDDCETVARQMGEPIDLVAVRNRASARIAEAAMGRIRPNESRCAHDVLLLASEVARLRALLPAGKGSGAVLFRRQPDGSWAPVTEEGLFVPAAALERAREEIGRLRAVPGAIERAKAGAIAEVSDGGPIGQVYAGIYLAGYEKALQVARDAGRGEGEGKADG